MEWLNRLKNKGKHEQQFYDNRYINELRQAQESNSDVAWVKFCNMFCPIPESYANYLNKGLSPIIGDTYIVPRKSGKDMMIQPYLLSNWSSSHGFLQDWLLMLAFNSDQEIIGFRSSHITHDDDPIHVKGVIGSAIPRDGIASSLESVWKNKLIKELATRYSIQYNISGITENIEDFNGEMYNLLQKLYDENPLDRINQHLLADAQDERKRWHQIYPDKSTNVKIDRSNYLQTGLSLLQRSESTFYSLNNSRDLVYNPIASVSLNLPYIDMSSLLSKMQNALLAPPERKIQKSFEN